jgi:hypothetical protein
MPHRYAHIARRYWLCAECGLYNVPPSGHIRPVHKHEFYLMQGYEV